MYSFFEHIADRKNKENDLSDFIWAMCMASDFFKKFFLNFFFPGVLFENDTTISREVVGKNSSRVDMYIKKNDTETYIIEIKINDRRLHFEQYINDFNITKDKVGFISNYKIYEEEFITKTWDEFYDELSTHLPNLNSNSNSNIDSERILLEGFLIYLKKICNLDTINMEDIMNYEELYTANNFSISLNKTIYKNDLLQYKELKSAYNFTVLLKKTINKITIKDKYYLISQDEPWLRCLGNANNSLKAGYYFSVTFLNKKRIINNIFIGVYLEEKLPKLCILFEEPFIDFETYNNLTKKIIEFKDNHDYLKKPEKDKDGIWFTLKEEKLKEYGSKNLKENSKLIEVFIKSVLEFSFHDLLIS